MRVVLVTGGTGLLGSAIREVAGEADFVFVGSKDADLTDWDQTWTLFQRHRPTHVVHLAARVGGLFANQNDPRGFFLDNMSINTNVLEASRKIGADKVVSCLSTCVFPDGAPLPLKPEDIHRGPPHPSNEGYAYAKRMLEVMSRMYAAETGRPYVCVIPTNMYGPNDNFNMRDAHVLPALIHRAHLAAASGHPLRIRGTGTPVRQFLHARDAARMVLDVLDRYEDSTRPLIMADPREVSTRRVGELVAAEYGIPLQTDDDPAADGQLRKASLPAVDFFGPCRVTLETGIRETVAWFEARYPDGVRGA